MRGLFEKDIRIIKNQKKMMLIFAGMGVLLLLSGVEISFILPYMASVMTSVAISTISYDSMDNGNSFLFTLPVRRKDYATEKYFFVCGFGAVSALIVAIACGILLLVRKSEMTAGAFGVEIMTCSADCASPCRSAGSITDQIRGRKIKDRDSGNGWYSGSGL